MDEQQREVALRVIRNETLSQVARVVRSLTPAAEPRLLEVGCGHGWFLEFAHQQGFRVAGLEPDFPVARQAASTGLPVSCGLFPHSVALKPAFDVVVFNDVLEHLPHLPEVAAGVASCLRAGGLIVVNGPCREGALYRLSEFADKLGVHGPLNRLWQQNLPSPHLSYFRPSDLVRLFRSIGAIEVYRSPVRSVRVRGLWNRLRYTRKDSVLVSALQWVALAAVAPLLGRLSPDIVLQVFRLGSGGVPVNHESTGESYRTAEIDVV
jgi:SAM-dependent methyltransferase